MRTAVAKKSRTDVVFASVVSGAYASAATALLFLLIDGARGQLLYTPSLLGSMVFLGQDAASVAPVRMDMGALYSVVHLAVFVLIGTAVTNIHQAWQTARSPWVLGALVMTGLSVGVLLVDALFYPGVIDAIGPVALTAGNAAAAATMTWMVTKPW